MTAPERLSGAFCVILATWNKSGEDLSASVLWPEVRVAIVSEPLVLPESVIASAVANVAGLP